jgi:hypothetical protein
MVSALVAARRCLFLAVGFTVFTAGMVEVNAGASDAGVTAVRGSAYGYKLDMSLFGGYVSSRGVGQFVCTTPYSQGVPAQPEGCAGDFEDSASPIVELPPAGGEVNQTDADGVQGVVDPAKIFTSGRIDLSTSGSLGFAGSVTSTTDIADVNQSRVEVFGEDGFRVDPTTLNGTLDPEGTFPRTSISSTCTANASGATGSTTITNGKLYLDSGKYVNGDDDFADPGEHPPIVVTVPTNPAPNTTYEGHLHVGFNGLDNYRYVLNEQIVNPDGSLTVYAAHMYLIGPIAVGDLWVGKSECGVSTDTVTEPQTEPPADFDGNGSTDRSVFTDGAWYVDGQPAVFFGLAGDIPVPGDYDGNGTADRALFRDGAWYTQDQPTAFWGVTGDIPVPGDYDGDGTTDRAVYRPDIGGWFIQGQPAVFWGGADQDIPVPGDYDGNGTTDIAVYRDGAWYVNDQAAAFWGLAGDIPVPGDYDGNGTTDKAIYRNGAWHIQGQASVYHGLAGYIPQPGDYDGNGTTDITVYKDGAWYVEDQPTVYFGLAGHTPLPLPHAIYREFFTP